LPREHFVAQGRKKILPGFTRLLVTREDVQNERVCPTRHARTRTPIEGAEDSAYISRREAKWFGLLCELELGVTESVTRAGGREEFGDLGTNLVQRQSHFRGDRPPLKAEVKFID